MATSADALIGKAASQIGGYFPGNSPYGVWYDARRGNPNIYDAASFCAMGLSWCAEQVGALDIFPEHAYTPSGAAWFRARGQFKIGTAGIRRGDIVYFDWGTMGRISHVGIVESVNSDGSFNCIEFNTSGTASGNQRNGRAVVRKRRLSVGKRGGYGRPSYSGSASGGAPSTPEWYGSMGWRLLQSGMSGADVTALQKLVGVSADGVFGAQTKAAVVAWQKSRGLEADGVFGPKSQDAAKGAKPVNKPIPAPAPKPKGLVVDGSFGPESIKALQRKLGVTADGVFGPVSKKALQKRLGVVQDGSVGPATIRALQRHLNARGAALARDGDWGSRTTAALQRVLNAGTF